MTRWSWLVLAMVLSGLGCGDGKDTSRTSQLFDQLSARETAYHASVNGLESPASIRVETADYAADMHDMLDSMQEACNQMMHGTATMGGHNMDDMTPIMDHMRGSLDDYNSHMQGMDDIVDMRAACTLHHSNMMDMLQNMNTVLEDVMPCCGG